MSRENVEVIRQGAAAWRGLDLVEAFQDEEFLRGLELFAEVLFDPEFEFQFVGPPPLETIGPRRGGEGFIRAWRDWLDGWEEFRIVPEEPVDLGDDRVLLPLRQTGQARAAGARFDEKSAAIYRFRNGKIQSWHAYFYEADALEAAGLQQ